MNRFRAGLSKQKLHQRYRSNDVAETMVMNVDAETEKARPAGNHDRVDESEAAFGREITNLRLPQDRVRGDRK